MHKYWHFVDTPYKADKTKTKPAPSVNAKTEIAILRKALKSKKTSDDVKSYDLAWLEHLVRDVHQPLHCTSRCDSADTSGDSGGNNVKITGGGNRSENASPVACSPMPHRAQHRASPDIAASAREVCSCLALEACPDDERTACHREVRGPDEGPVRAHHEHRTLLPVLGSPVRARGISVEHHIRRPRARNALRAYVRRGGTPDSIRHPTILPP